MLVVWALCLSQKALLSPSLQGLQTQCLGSASLHLCFLPAPQVGELPSAGHTSEQSDTTGTEAKYPEGGKVERLQAMFEWAIKFSRVSGNIIATFQETSEKPRHKKA